MQKLELLAPAKNLECGIAAIDHGADAVYIGAPKFGARAAAGNSIDDISELCRYAHQFSARVYVTVNTLINDDEIEHVRKLLRQLGEIGVDAILVQDMAIVEMMRNGNCQLPTNFQLSLHASTQTDNRTASKVAWLQQLGFSRVVLARELSLDEIRSIHEQVPDVELEVFVHGALCVSYSGQCYASEYCFGRSANRGECAQFCRLKFNLIDADGREIVHQRHLLSLKDLCLIDRLEELAEAGACSFKIEGRLKDVGYVKNVVSAYSQRLNNIIRHHPDRYERSSKGRVEYSFEPNLKKTFNRGMTHYFLDGRCGDIASFDTPKAIGEYVGRVKEIRDRSFTVAGTAAFANGDGLCFINDEHELEGFRVNRAEGNRLFPHTMPSGIHQGTPLYRNNDVSFEKILSGKTAIRRLPVRMVFSAIDSGFLLNVIGDGFSGAASVESPHELANNEQRENIIRQLTRLGGTIYQCDDVEIVDDADKYFVPSSQLAYLRREALADINTFHSDENQVVMPSKPASEISQSGLPLPHYTHRSLYNISNSLSEAFYSERGVSRSSNDGAPLMQCRHCLRYALGYCTRHGGKRPAWREPLHLQLSDGRQFRLQFDCKECQMNVYGVTD